MAELLKCPTCAGAISSNAIQCPHCGETEFIGAVEIQEVCPSCKGAKVQDRLETRVRSFRYIFGLVEDETIHVPVGKMTCGTCNGTGMVTVAKAIDLRR